MDETVQLFVTVSLTAQTSLALTLLRDRWRRVRSSQRHVRSRDMELAMLDVVLVLVAVVASTRVIANWHHSNQWGWRESAAGVWSPLACFALALRIRWLRRVRGEQVYAPRHDDS